MADEYARLIAQQQGIGYSPRENIYGQIGGTIASALPQLVRPYASSSSNIATVLGGSLLAGLLGYQAKQEAAEKNQALIPAITGIMGATDVAGVNTRLGTFDPEVATRLAPIAIQRMSALQERELLQEQAAAKRLQELEDFKTKEEFKQNLDRKAQERERERLENVFGQYNKPTLEENDLNPNIESLNTRYNRYVKEELALGLPATAATNNARTLFSVEQARTKKDQENLLADEQRTRETMELLNLAEQAINDAGETGGPGLVKWARNVVRDYGQYFSEDLRREKDGEVLFNGVMARIVSQLRSPGAVSNFEFDILSQAGVSKDNTPTQNQKILQTWKSAGQFRQKHNTFLRQYIQQKGTTDGAFDIIDMYKKQNFKGGNPFSIKYADVEIPDIGNWSINFFKQKRINEQPVDVKELKEQNPGITNLRFIP